jgi:phage repressor protein C with HTH and peptisase S24 domain
MEKMGAEDSIAQRYAFVRERAGLTKKAFADSLGIHAVVSGDIELGKRDPSRDVLVRLARVYDVDLNWLLTGNTAQPAMDREGGDSMVVNIELIDQEAAAGRGVEIEEYAETTRLPVLRSFIAPRKPDRVRAVEVRGDSMTGIGLDDRDVVLFAPDERTGDGVHVVSISGQLLVKRILFDAAGHSVHVISENPSYPPRVLTGADVESFRVEGRVIGWMHRY